MSFRRILRNIVDFFDGVAVPGSWAQLISIGPEKAPPAEAEHLNHRTQPRQVSPVHSQQVTRERRDILPAGKDPQKDFN
jgi:hypothetical protein